MFIVWMIWKSKFDYCSFSPYHVVKLGWKYLLLGLWRLKGGSSADARLPVLIFYGWIFGNFDSITRINFIVINMHCLQYAFYFFSHYKSIGCMWRASKQSNYTAPGPRPRFLNFWIRHWWLPIVASLSSISWHFHKFFINEVVLN